MQSETPPFIDAHGHSDIAALAAPDCASKHAQGFGTEICGNCGLSAFPLTEKNRPHLQELYRQYNVSLDWNTGDEYRERLKKADVRLRLVSFCGHNTLHAAVAGYAERALDAGERRKACSLLRDELDAGALGLSLGLLYVPGIFADNQELEELFCATAAAEKIVSVHLRSEGARLLESLREILGLAERSNLGKLQISHFKTAGRPNWGKLDEAFDLLDAARETGLEINFDRYPYLESMTQLSIVAPEDQDDEALEKYLRDEKNFAVFCDALQASGRDWSAVRLVSGGGPEFAGFRGWKLEEIARRRGTSPHRLAAEMLRNDAIGATAAFAGMCAENLHRILRDPHCMLGTDEGIKPVSGVFGWSHPRGFGSAPEFIRLLEELSVPRAEIVRRLTELPQTFFGLEPDPRRIRWSAPRSDADFANPHRLAEGVCWV